jgi:hypothetical protein
MTTRDDLTVLRTTAEGFREKLAHLESCFSAAQKASMRADRLARSDLHPSLRAEFKAVAEDALFAAKGLKFACDEIRPTYAYWNSAHLAALSDFNFNAAQNRENQR